MQVVEPKVKAYLYTWGAGRTTAEGEHIPVRIEELDIGYIDTMLILPLIIEHTIDERSPLCGHTHDSLMAVRPMRARDCTQRLPSIEVAILSKRCLTGMQWQFEAS